MQVMSKGLKHIFRRNTTRYETLFTMEVQRCNLKKKIEFCKDFFGQILMYF